MRLLTQRAFDAYRRMQYERAAKAAQTVLCFDPKHLGMCVMMARIEGYWGRWDVAVIWWLRVIQGGRRDAATVLRAVEVALWAKNVRQAQAILEMMTRYRVPCTPQDTARARGLGQYIQSQLSPAGVNASRSTPPAATSSG